MRPRVIRGVVVMLALVTLAVPSARASELSDDLAARRARVMNALGPDTMLVVWSAPPQRYSRDIDYEYRQDSDLYYLTGITQDDTIAVLMPGNETRREILFIKDRNPGREHWTGRSLTPEEATARSGIETVLATSQFDAFISAILGRTAFAPLDDRAATPFFAAL